MPSVRRVHILRHSVLTHPPVPVCCGPGGRVVVQLFFFCVSHRTLIFFAVCVLAHFPSFILLESTCRPRRRSPLSLRLRQKSLRFLPLRRPLLRLTGVASTPSSRQVRDCVGFPPCWLSCVGLFLTGIALALPSCPLSSGRMWWSWGHIRRPKADCRRHHRWVGGVLLPPRARLFTSFVFPVWSGFVHRRRVSEARRRPPAHTS